MQSPPDRHRRRWAAALVAAALLIVAVVAISAAQPKGSTVRNLTPPGRVSVPCSAGALASYTPTFTMAGTTWSSQQGRYMITPGLLYVWGGANLATGGGAVATLTITLPYTVAGALPTGTQWVVGNLTNGAPSASRADLANIAFDSLRTISNLTAVGGSFYTFFAVIPIAG